MRQPKKAAASAKAGASPVVSSQPANPTPEQWEIENTADGGYDDRDWDALAFQRTGKNVAKKAPCKYFPLGTCTKGKACKYNHTNYKDPKHHRRAAVAQAEGEPEAQQEEEAVPPDESQDAVVAAAAKGKGKGKGKDGKGNSNRGNGKRGGKGY